MKTAKVLLTGFEPFGDVAENPSQQIVAHLQMQRTASTGWSL